MDIRVCPLRRESSTCGWGVGSPPVARGEQMDGLPNSPTVGGISLLRRESEAVTPSARKLLLLPVSAPPTSAPAMLQDRGVRRVHTTTSAPGG